MASTDITFCTGIIRAKLSEEILHEVECPLRSTCHRFISMPKAHTWLSVFSETPWDNFKNECLHYWVIDRKHKTKARKKK
jgi:hypothetical protein